MKADESSSYSSSSLLNIMIPQFQQLSPLETPVSGRIVSNKNFKKNSNKKSILPFCFLFFCHFFSRSLPVFFSSCIYVGSWLNTQFMSESTNKLLSPPVSVTPTSICTG